MSEKTVEVNEEYEARSTQMTAQELEERRTQLRRYVSAVEKTLDLIEPLPPDEWPLPYLAVEALYDLQWELVQEEYGLDDVIVSTENQ
jgi:hypothetical protein